MVRLTTWSALHLAHSPAMRPKSGLKYSAINTSKLLESPLVEYILAKNKHLN